MEAKLVRFISSAAASFVAMTILIGSRFLHLVLLPFHEAGHYAIFRWFGPFIMTLGGTLGQHLLPIVAGYALLVQRRDKFGAALCLWLQRRPVFLGA